MRLKTPDLGLEGPVDFLDVELVDRLLLDVAAERPGARVGGGVGCCLSESSLSDAKVEVDERQLDGGEEQGVEGAERDELLCRVEAESTGPGERDVGDGDGSCVRERLELFDRGST